MGTETADATSDRSEIPKSSVGISDKKFPLCPPVSEP